MIIDISSVLTGEKLSQDIDYKIEKEDAAVLSENLFGIGRGFGEYGGAHQPDEYIECEKLLNFAKVLAHFVLSWDETNK